MIHIIQKVTAAFLAVFLTAFVGGTNATYDVKDSENIKLNFTVVSDIHMEGNNAETRHRQVKAFKAIKKCSTPNDALITVGDNVMNGQNIEYLFLNGILKNIKPADKYYLCLGNHEIGNGNNKYEELSKRFVSYANSFSDDKIENVYYKEIINGCYFIFLGSESDEEVDEYIFDDELDWFEGVMDEASASGNPIFVFNHAPFNSIANIDGRERLRSILTSYDNVFFFVGHTHWALNSGTVRYVDAKREKTPYIYMPCFKEEYNDTENAVGAQVEVYEDSVSIRFRGFASDSWIDGYDFNFNLTK